MSKVSSTIIVTTEDDLTDQQLHQLFGWLDEIPLSRKKKSITRDFSDGVLVAEIVHHFLPKLVELHNYASANSVNQKMTNWDTLNRKVLSKLSFMQPAETVRKICECTPSLVEVFLYHLSHKIDAFLMKYVKRTSGSDRPYYNVRSDSIGQASGQNNSSRAERSSNAGHSNGYIVKNPLPLSDLNISALPESTRLILEEKEQALLASQESVQILQVKIHRLEHLLQLKDLRIEDLSKRLVDAENMIGI